MKHTDRRHWHVPENSFHSRRQLLKVGALVTSLLACKRAKAMGLFAGDLKGAVQRGSLADDIVWPLTDELSKDADVHTFAARESNLAGEPIIAVTSGRVDCLDTHLYEPRSCYAANGFQITKTESIGIKLGSANVSAALLTAQRNERVEYILCWGRLDAGWPATSAMTTEALVGALLEQPNSRLTIVRLTIRNVSESDARRMLVSLAERIAVHPPQYARKTSIAPEYRRYNSCPAQAIAHAFERCPATIL